jgi:hypothetical protein
MMAHNLCYSTLLSREAAARLPASAVLRSPTGDAFVKKDLAVGILPEILEELLAARKRAKKDLKEATDPFAKAVLDGRQLVRRRGEKRREEKRKERKRERKRRKTKRNSTHPFFLLFFFFFFSPLPSTHLHTNRPSRSPPTLSTASPERPSA